MAPRVQKVVKTEGNPASVPDVITFRGKRYKRLGVYPRKSRARNGVKVFREEEGGKAILVRFDPPFKNLLSRHLGEGPNEFGVYGREARPVADI